MYRWLAAHPEVFVPVKEIHYFGEDLAHRRPPVSEERYRSLFAEAGVAHRAVGDVAVWYLMSESAAEEIHAFNPDARIIVMLRRPDDMLYSLHSQLVYSGEEDRTDFEAALDAEPERAQGRSIPESTHKGLEAPPTECLLYSRVASFADQVERYQQRFEHVHVVLHDDIKADAAEVYRGVLDFLGVEPTFSPDFSVVNPNTKAKSQLARKLIQGVWFGPLRSVVPASLRSVGRRGLESLQALNTQTAPRPPLDAHLRQRLQKQLGPDIERLASLIGRDLSSWLMD
jgi:hypothetical protein